MEIDVLLCDHAEVADNKLFINGAGISIFWVQPKPPHAIKASVATVTHVPYTATNQLHKLVVSLVDTDGAEVRPWVPDGQPEPPPVKIAAEFNVGRPPMLVPGEAQAVPFAGAFHLPLPDLGRYEFKVELDGTTVRRLPFRLEAQNVAQTRS